MTSDLSKWTPDMHDTFPIMRELRSYVDATTECCGKGSEEEVDAIQLYNAIKRDGIDAAKDAVQGFFLDLYEAVKGDLDKYASYPELVHLIRLTLGLD